MKRFRWIALATLATLVLGVGYLLTRPTAFELGGTVIEAAPSVSHLTLASTSGETVTLGAWRGKTLLVFFGYASCPDVCPLTMARLAEIYRGLGEPRDLQVVMVTVDPERDTPEILQAYVENFHPSFVGLSGTLQQIADASARFYASAAKHDDGDVAHSSHVTLVGPDGRMRAVYTQGNVGEVLETDLETLLAGTLRWAR